MSDKDPNFQLPKKLDHFLATVAKLYAQGGNRRLQEIVVNAQTQVDEGWTYDNWNGGTYGHAVHLIVPEKLFLEAVNQKTEIQNQIREGLNKVHNAQNEFFADVFLEVEAAKDSNWRADSGLLLLGRRFVPPEATKRIWEDGVASPRSSVYDLPTARSRIGPPTPKPRTKVMRAQIKCLSRTGLAKRCSQPLGGHYERLKDEMKAKVTPATGG